MDYRNKRYFAIEHFGQRFYWDSDNKVSYFRDLIQTRKYFEWRIKEFGNPYDCFRHFNPDHWKQFNTKHIVEYCGFLPNKVVSVDKYKAEEFTKFLEENDFKYFELMQYMFGQ